MANFYEIAAAVNKIMCIEMLFSLALSALLINLVLMIHIKFGDKIVTTLTMKPYIISLILCSVMVFEFIWLCFLKEVRFKNDDDAFFEKLLVPEETNTVNRFQSTMMQIKIDLVLVFILF